MANKKKRKPPKRSVIYWRTFIATILMQIIVIAGYCTALHSWWPASEYNTDTVIGAVESIALVAGRRAYIPEHLSIVVDGQTYQYSYMRNEQSLDEMMEAVKPGDIVEISFKSRTVASSYDAVVAMKDQTQTYRDIESYNANAMRDLLLLAVLCSVLSFVLWLTWFAYKRAWYEAWSYKLCQWCKKKARKKKKQEKKKQKEKNAE